MHNNLVKRYATILWVARKRAAEPKDLHDRYAVINAKREFRHYMYQNTHDLNRRGHSNREGAQNRSFRKHLNPQPCH